MQVFAEEASMTRAIALALAGSLLLAAVAVAQTREQKVRGDKAKVEAAGFWIYNDLPKAFAQAKESGKPLVVVLRCIPCEECVKLDDDLVDQDKRLQAALEKFVRVRVVSANGLDLSLFQFDTDQSFAVFMLNADGTIYGRYGTRSDHSHWADDVSVEGLAKALEGALELHAAYPQNRNVLTAKRGLAAEVAVPENFPTLKGKYGSQLNYEGNVVQSCIHCHQIGDAQRQMVRDKHVVLPDKVLFPYPHPKSIGLILDPKERATVLRVEPGSLAERAAFEPGDQIQTLAGQPLLSMADIQWVLHHVPAEGGSVKGLVLRGGKLVEVTLVLSTGWRQQDDIAWRASSWELRRIALGGLFLKNVSPEQRAARKLPERGLALRVEHAGQYAPHDVAKIAGFRKEDVLVEFDGRTDLARETDLLHYALNHKQPGSKVPVTIVREGKRTTLTLPIGR
jgi:hypothetical protein